MINTLSKVSVVKYSDLIIYTDDAKYLIPYVGSVFTISGIDIPNRTSAANKHLYIYENPSNGQIKVGAL